MCKMKSAIIMKDRVFIPDYDSHSEMLNELGIEDTRENAERLFVRAELYPKDGDVFSNIDTWAFRVDQDIRPEWFVEEVDKARMVEAVKEWAKTHIFIGVNNLKISSGKNIYIKDCKDVEICDSASVKYICGSASVENIYGSASVENIFDSASVKNIYGNASVKYIYDSASVKYIYDSASVKYICGNASVEKASGYACISSSRNTDWKKADSLILCENATFRNRKTKTIYQSGGWELVSVEGK